MSPAVRERQRSQRAGERITPTVDGLRQLKAEQRRGAGQGGPVGPRDGTEQQQTAQPDQAASRQRIRATLHPGVR